MAIGVSAGTEVATSKRRALAPYSSDALRDTASDPFQNRYSVEEAPPGSQRTCVKAPGGEEDTGTVVPLQSAGIAHVHSPTHRSKPSTSTSKCEQLNTPGFRPGTVSVTTCSSVFSVHGSVDPLV